MDQGLSVIDAGRSFDGLRTNGRALSVRRELVESQQFWAQARKPIKRPWDMDRHRLSKTECTRYNRFVTDLVGI